MRKNIILIFAIVASLFSLSSKAQDKPIKLDPSKKDVSEVPGKPQRTPLHIPTVTINENTLSFDSTCEGSFVTVLDECKTVVFTAIVPSGLQVTLPYLSDGTYELLLQRGSITFQGFFQMCEEDEAE